MFHHFAIHEQMHKSLQYPNTWLRKVFVIYRSMFNFSKCRAIVSPPPVCNFRVRILSMMRNWHLRTVRQ
uniref:Uncharacterized protein n=1 Tax=Anguilla anguilla TaxID=7936 RepID=A0A0E9T1J8_ANGAN